MDEKRSLNLDRMFLSFILATIIFISIFLFAYGVSYFKSKDISSDQEKIYYKFLEQNLKNKFELNKCDSQIHEFSYELDTMGSLLGILEEKLGKENKKVLEQKKLYSLIEIQHSFLIKEYNLQCNKKIPIIFFFYSNNKSFETSAEKMGFILSSFKNQHSGVMIYSLDYDLNSTVLHLLKEEYNITRPNTILINEEIIIHDLKNIKDLEKYLF